MADPNPLAQAASDVGNAFTGVVNTVLGAPGNLTNDAQNAIDTLLSKVESRIGGVLDAIQRAGVPPPPTPADVRASVEQIIQAIVAAEAKLNDSGLVIASGSIEATLRIALPGGIAGADARISMQITPKPVA